MKRRNQLAAQNDVREHQHACEHPARDERQSPIVAHIDDCMERGYCVCRCGATKGMAASSEWIKSHATRGWPGVGDLTRDGGLMI